MGNIGKNVFGSISGGIPAYAWNRTAGKVWVLQNCQRKNAGVQHRKLKEEREVFVKKILGLNGEYYQLLAGKNPSTREYNTTYKMQEKGLHPTWQQVQIFCKVSEEFHQVYPVYHHSQDGTVHQRSVRRR